MKAAITRSAALVVALLCFCACADWYAREVEETREGLIGLAGRDLRECLGVPSDFVIDGDVEQQSYRFEHDDEREAALRTGGIGGVVMGGSSPGDRSYDTRGFPVDDSDKSYCQLDFELTNGLVTRVSAQGRTREGMNADTSCLLRAQVCLPYADEVEPGATE